MKIYFFTCGILTIFCALFACTRQTTRTTGVIHGGNAQFALGGQIYAAQFWVKFTAQTSSAKSTTTFELAGPVFILNSGLEEHTYYGDAIGFTSGALGEPIHGKYGTLEVDGIYYARKGEATVLLSRITQPISFTLQGPWSDDMLPDILSAYLFRNSDDQLSAEVMRNLRKHLGLPAK
jgi:hypothetical protein